MPIVSCLRVLPSVLVALLALLLAAPPAAANDEVPRIANLNIDATAVAGWIKDNQLVVAFHPRAFDVHGPEQLQTKQVRFYSGISVVDAPPAEVRRRLTDFVAYPKMLSVVEHAEIEQADPEAGRWRVDMGIELDFQIISLSTNYVADYWLQDDSLLWRAVKGDMVGSTGRWEFLPLGDDRTLLTYTTYTNYDDAGFLLGAILKAQPDLQLALPASLAAVAVRSMQQAIAGGDGTPPPTRNATVPLFTKGELPLETAKQLAEHGTLMVAFPERTLLAPGQQVPLVFVTAVGLVDAPMPDVKHLSTALPRYKEFFSQVKSVDIKPLEGNKGILGIWRLGIDFGVLSVPIQYVNQYLWAGDNAMVYRRIGGDIEFIFGAYEWVPVGDNRTLYFFTAAATPGKNGSRMVKLTELVPNSQMILAISSSAIIMEKQIPWIEAQVRDLPARAN